MRRLLAGILMAIGLIVGSLTLSGWWIRQTVLDPDRTERVADAVLENPSVRRELARRLVDGVAATLPPEATGPLASFRTEIQDALASPALTAPLASVVTDVHRRLIGMDTGPVVIDPGIVGVVLQQAAPGLDPALISAVPAVSFEVPQAKPLNTARERLPEVLGKGAIAALALIAAAFAVHPRRDRLLVRLGWWMLGVSAIQVFFLYLLPVVLAPALVDNVWTGLVSEVATASASGVIGLLAALAVGGVGCLITGWSWGAASVGGRRRVAPAPVPIYQPAPPSSTYSPGGPVRRAAPPGRDGPGWRL